MRAAWWLLAFLLGASAHERPTLPAAARGSLLPWTRVVSYYGNPLSKRMGILGELPPEQMMDRLEAVAAEWRRADPATPVRPALELVTVVAQEQPGPDGLYRARMDAPLIDRVIRWANSRGWLVILDAQVGHSSVAEEVRHLEPFLSRPNVHLALDPEFDMEPSVPPGRRIGGSGADEINEAVRFLAEIVRRRGVPPKLLIVHRFIPSMLRDPANVRLDPRVQVAVVMDGFGPPGLKRRIYRICVANEPVQHAGIKLFYKNDKPLLTPREVLSLSPIPQVIIYQ